jgi:hypothetical protein
MLKVFRRNVLLHEFVYPMLCNHNGWIVFQLPKEIFNKTRLTKISLTNFGA